MSRLRLLLIGILLLAPEAFAFETPGTTEKSSPLSTSIELFKLLGGFAGFLGLYLKYRDGRKSYLQISLEVDNDSSDFPSALTTAENSGVNPKKIEYAVLIISRQDVGSDIISDICNGFQPKQTNDYRQLKNILKSYEPVYSTSKKGAILPLFYYSKENIEVADEKLQYRVSIDRSRLAVGTYDVRFFVYPPNGLHISVHDLLVVRPTSELPIS